MLPIRLVPLDASHADAVAAAVRDPQIQRFTRVPDPLPADWARTWIDGFDGHDRHGWAVLDEAGTFVGYAVTGPVDHDGREVEVGYAVVPDARGRGVATATLEALSRWAIGAGMLRVTALVSVQNPASARVAAKVGYTLEGVLRSVHHRGDLRVDLQSWSLLPGDPRPTLG